MKSDTKQKPILALIVANEFCERYCFYSIRSVLFTFLISDYNLSIEKTTFLVHMFVFLSYLFGVLGGIIADGFIGRYKTIIYFNFIYFLGNVMLLCSSIRNNFFVLISGLVLISMGTGGIKPCISAFGGDQLKNANKKNMETFFSIFYFSINAGSLFGIIFSPILATYNCKSKDSCFSNSFKVSTFLHSVSIIMFLLGSLNYTKVNPDKQFLIRLWRYIRVKYSELFSIKKPSAQIEQIEDVQIICPDTQKDVHKTLKIFKIFLFVPFFWMLYDQHSSSWIDQGNKMNTQFKIFNYNLAIYPSQMSAINSLSVIFMIPLFVRYIYPALNKRGMLINPLEKMYLGLALCILSFGFSTFVQIIVDSGYKLNIFFQIPQYLILTAGEILMSITGLQFAYSQSPETMKSLVFSGWLLTTALGNLYIMVFSIFNPFKLFKGLSFSLETQLFSSVVGMVGLFWMIHSCKNHEYY